MVDRDRTVSRRSEPSSRNALMGEQPNPWDLLQPQDAPSRHRGAKPFRRCGLLGRISLLSPEYLLSVERRQFHSLPPDHGLGLEARNTKGGIPRVTPRRLAPPVQSLPPILDNMPRTPTSSCSKGSRGLSVQPRVLGIFTETTVSPDPSLRQRPSRYAIRAGRNLPDKEFRYLRTVIVTAAVYRGLASRLRPKANLSA